MSGIATGCTRAESDHRVLLCGHDQRRRHRQAEEDDDVVIVLHEKRAEQSVEDVLDAREARVINYRDEESSLRNGSESDLLRSSSRQQASPDRRFLKEHSVESNQSVEQQSSLNSEDDSSDEEFVLEKLENVTAQSRSFISPELLEAARRKRGGKFATPMTNRMASKSATMPSNSSSKRRGLFRKKSSNGSKKRLEKRDDAAQESSAKAEVSSISSSSASLSSSNRSNSAPIKNKVRPDTARGRETVHRYSSLDDNVSFGSEETPVKSNSSASNGSRPPRPGIVQRIRSASRSRSRSRSRKNTEEIKPILVAVTSCRSDAYYNQKAPGSTSKLPRKAPSNLKLFHELAVGVKDAYAAVGETPTKPEEQVEGQPKMPTEEFEGRMVLWEFMGNIDFLLALVDEVAIDTATRGALKDDTTFKCLRDVIKKCNKILEAMLVRRERRYTLFIRLVQPIETKEIAQMKSWNAKVEKAVGAVADSRSARDETDDESVTSASTSASSTSGRSGMFSRGRQLLPSAGRVRARRATPTPALRKKRGKGTAQPDAVAAEDGYSAVTAPVTQGNLAMLQRSLAANESPQVNKMGMPAPAPPPKQQLAPVKPMEPKDELVDVIRGLRVEKLNRTKEGASAGSTVDSDLAALKPNWQPKADIPTSVPKLPPEYIHRHRLMKQVVSCLLERSGAGPRDMDEEVPTNTFITSITSRHGDKPGNGKTTLAVAAIQTVEVRERFSDGIAWVQLGRAPLGEKDIRRLYEELYRQLVMKDSDEEDEDDEEESSKSSSGKPISRQSSFASLDRIPKEDDKAVRYSIFGQLAESRRRFHNGDLDGIKEDLGRILSKRKVLICLDDVWRVEDAKWFIFDTKSPDSGPNSRRSLGSTAADEPYPYRILLTTRTPALLGAGVVQEVFVRIFSEPEAVKLLLSSAGRRPYGGKNSAVFNQARVIVKGCGNSPLAVRIAGGMLRRSNRNWNLSSPTWTSLMTQCKLNLEEASRLRSFVNSAGRIVDLSFMTTEERVVRASMRRCFVMFAMAFHDNDWVLLGRGIPQAVVLRLFETVITSSEQEVSPRFVLEMLEAVHLMERARHGISGAITASAAADDDSPNTSMDEPITGTLNPSGGPVSVDDSLQDFSLSRHHTSIHDSVLETPSFVMQDSIKAIAEEMAGRSTQSFLPEPDEFTSFADEIEAEKASLESGRLWSAPFRYLARQLANSGQGSGMDERQVHELVVASLLDIKGSISQSAVTDSYEETRSGILSVDGGEKLEEYMAAFVPTHLMQAEALPATAELLVDSHFISRRVAALGAIEGTRRHMADLLELRRVVGKSAHAGGQASVSSPKKSKRNAIDAPASPTHGHDAPLTPNSPESPTISDFADNINVDAVAVLREGSHLVIDEVYRVANAASGSSDSLTMAICLSCVGEGLLKCRQPRDAMLRLEEAVGIYRGLLGPFHIEVARSLHSVAKAMVKLGETRVALLKFGEAARIYDACEASLHFDSIANAQNMASLLVELGEWSKAEEKFFEVVAMKKAVYGEANASVAKAINSYAILLAKHGRMNEALRHYESAKATYAAVQPSTVKDPEFELKCMYDVTLINLNIASIKSKKGDLDGAIESYNEGVRGLREHEAAQKKLESSSGDVGRSHSHNKHLVAALGRIGSLKLKQGDIEGALEMYVMLLNEVDENSPTASRTEKAKAHIKCATIYRQLEGKDAHIKSISHLREALEMYTMLFGPEHKDTQAIAKSLRQWLSEDQSS